MANLLIEIGNTALKAAWSEGTTLGKTFRYQGMKTMEFILSLTAKEKAEVMAVASAGEVTADEEKLLRGECRHLVILDRNHTDILLKHDLPEHLSHDRASAIMAAGFLFQGKACTVFDLGTTLTVDFLDSEGRYMGGSISPGCRTRFKSLERYTRSLPLVNMPAAAVKEGRNLRSSIESGVISGIKFEIEGYIRQHPGNIVIFTGGDAMYFARMMDCSSFVAGNLVLMGLAIITDDYVKKNLS